MPKEATRHDKGKRKWHLLPWKGIEEVVKVAENGAKKYGKYNYFRGMAWSRVIDSAFRHLVAIRNGEDIDQESKCLHSAHLVFNGLMLCEYFKYHRNLDDRTNLK